LTSDVARLLFKVGVKAVNPLLGELASALIEQSGELLLDRKAKEKLADTFHAVLAQLEGHASWLVQSEQVPVEEVEAAFADVTELLRKHALSWRDWVDCEYDAEKAARKVFLRARQADAALPSALDGASDLRHSLVHVFYAALAQNREALQQTDVEFRASMLRHINELPDRLARMSSDEARRAERLAACSLLEIPVRPWSREHSAPAALMHPECDHAAPFFGRRDHVDELLGWFDEPAPLALRLYTGAGGMGKTRLMLHVCRTFKQLGFNAGFLVPEALRAPPAVWRELCQLTGGFVVIDYAETRRREVSALLSGLAAAQAPDRWRVVLLARAAGSWWEDLKAAELPGVRDVLARRGTKWIQLPPVATTRDERRACFEQAVEAFSNALQSPPHAVDDADAFDGSELERILFIQARALGAVEGVDIKGEQGMLDFLLVRERSFWRRLATERGLDPSLVPAIGVAMAAITLRGGAPLRGMTLAAGDVDVEGLLEQLPLMRGQTAASLRSFALLLHDAYPGNRSVLPLAPDLLGEHLIAQEVAQNPDLITWAVV
jgi:hypothetical protein